MQRPRRPGQGVGRGLVAAVGASGETDRTPWGRRARRGAPRTAPRRVIPRAVTARVAWGWLTRAAASHNKICRRAVAIRPPPLTVRTPASPKHHFCGCGIAAHCKCRRTTSSIPASISAAIHDTQLGPWVTTNIAFGPPVVPGAKPSVLAVELRKL